MNPDLSPSPLDAAPRAACDDVSFPFANIEREELVWVPKRDPHLLVAGSDGSGKTFLVRHLLEEVRTAGWETWMAAGTVNAERDDAGIDRLAESEDERQTLVDDAHTVMVDRYRRRAETPLESLRPILLLIEEPSHLHDLAFENLTALAMYGRSVHVHLLITMTDLDGRLLAGHFRDVLSPRIGLGQLSPIASRMLFGDPVTGTKGDRGAGHIISSDGRIRAIRVPEPTVSPEGSAS